LQGTDRVVTVLEVVNQRLAAGGLHGRATRIADRQSGLSRRNRSRGRCRNGLGRTVRMLGGNRHVCRGFAREQHQQYACHQQRQGPRAGDRAKAALARWRGRQPFEPFSISEVLEQALEGSTIFFIRGGHRVDLGRARSLRTAVSNDSRARFKREATVPSGMLSTSATSARVICSSSAKTNTARSSSSSDAKASSSKAPARRISTASSGNGASLSRASRSNPALTERCHFDCLRSEATRSAVETRNERWARSGTSSKRWAS